MCRYLVVDLHASGPLFGLFDGYGKYHLARGLRQQPSLNAVLHGAQARIGWQFLSAAGTGLRYSVTFEQVRVSRQEMQDRLHASTHHPAAAACPAHPWNPRSLQCLTCP
jgi:hypothetical protein